MTIGALNGDGGDDTDVVNHEPEPESVLEQANGNPTTSSTGADISAHSWTQAPKHHPLQHRTSARKKVTTRPVPFASSSSLNSLSSQLSSRSTTSPATPAEEDRHGDYHNRDLVLDTSSLPHAQLQQSPQQMQDDFRLHQSLLMQVFNWLRQERGKLEAPDATPTSAPQEDRKQEQPSLALDQLEHILSQHSSSAVGGSSSSSNKAAAAAPPSGRRKISSSSSIKNNSSSSSLSSRRTASTLRRGSTSESDYFADADRPVPSAEVVLDNSKTLLYSGGEADSDMPALSATVSGSSAASGGSGKPYPNERDHWLHFKSEIVRLTHTLGFKGWRRVPIHTTGEVEVVRLSGALTNAVYVVSPPKNFPPPSAHSTRPRKPPPKLLLRIYGPQADHLINREHELRVLRRLAKKNIGPRVLGTFKNGRFEEYFHAVTLTAHDLRVPETSKQIAKRMRELHDGIELLPEERAAGPNAWNNWDSWVGRCEQVVTWLDNELLSGHNEDKAAREPWRKRGYVCAVPWKQFRETVERLRKWLDDISGGPAGLRQKLVFSHNDAQYGNLLRLEPSGESPLLLPANEHKQLVVIDFEYASANPKTFEFANHFTEWCYNYHSDTPWACNTGKYPAAEEQERFIRAYLKHRSSSGSGPSGSSTPSLSAANKPSNSATYTSTARIPPFVLDSHDSSSVSSPGTSAEQELNEAENARALDAEVAQIMRETRLWRTASSTWWIAWGIVQANVPGLEAALASTDTDANADADTEGNGDTSTPTAPSSPAADTTPENNNTKSNSADDDKTPPSSSWDTSKPPPSPPWGKQVLQEVEAEEAAEFDYLAYAQDRALFFWADLLTLGLVKEDELPAETVQYIKQRVIQR